MRFFWRQWLCSLLSGILLFAASMGAAAVEVPESELAKGPLVPEEAFRFRSIDNGQGGYLFEWLIEPYYYLYLDKFSFAAGDDERITFQARYSDNSQRYDDPFFGRLAIFRDYVTIDLTAFAPLGTAPDELTITYQGCWDGGVCYPPETIDVPLSAFAEPVAVALDGTSSTGGQATTPQPGYDTQKTAPQQEPRLRMVDVLTNNSDQRAFGGLLAGGKIWLLIAIFYLAGLALAFTPCVFPTIPLISGIISRQASTLNSIRGLLMMAVFVLSMSLTYTLAGIMAGLLGQNLQVILQQTWIIVVSAVLFLFLSGAMFGLYTLQLPVGLQNRLYKISSKQNQGTYIGLAMMGVFSALIVGPCLTAPLAGILIYLSGKGDPLLGGISLFALGIGMGTPLLLLGLFANKLMPKAGAWMERVQHFFGFAMLLLTVWILDRILEDDLVLLLYGIVVIAFAVYLLQTARHAGESGSQGTETLARTFAIVLLVFGIVQLVGYSLGSKDVWQPLRILQLGSGNYVKTQTGAAKIVASDPVALDQKLAELQPLGNPVLLKYEADWCIECKVIERRVFEDAEVLTQLADVSIISVDVTEVSDASEELLARYGLPGPPALMFYDSRHNRRDELMLLGNITRQRVLDALARL